MDELTAFHEVGRLFPAETSVMVVEPSTKVVDALRILSEMRYSQLPVVDGGGVRGVFSVWSLARHVAVTPSVNPANLTVGDLMDYVPTVTVEDSLHEVFQYLERYGVLLVGSPLGLQAIATHSDILRYFYDIARPFVLVQEIELSLRAVISHCAPGDALHVCVDNAIRGFYENQRRRAPPSRLEEMAFEDYRMIITAAKNWPNFESVLGRNRDLVASRLERVRELRNAVFHFRADLSVIDHQTLAGTRNWLLDKLRMSGALRREGDE